MVDPAWVALSLAAHLGGKKLRALLDHFGDTAAILQARPDELRRVPGIGPKIAATIGALRPGDLAAPLARWQAAGVAVIPWDDPVYPPALGALADAPPTLFVRGALRTLPDRAIAVVGTRAPSGRGEALAQQLGFELARRGYLVVSGLALGIDRAAHLGALGVPDGQTAAVLGSGVLNIYPQANRALAQAVLGRGALIAEVHPQAEANPASLVARNRLISGLSEAVIVVETGAGGGAMHAARRAWEQGRPVYAADCGADGNRELLASGALPLPRDGRDLPF